MRRIHLYLEDALWAVLNARAKADRKTMSELVGEAVRESYLSTPVERLKVMVEFVGASKDLPEQGDPTGMVRKLRRGSRIQRLFAE